MYKVLFSSVKNYYRRTQESFKGEVLGKVQAYEWYSRIKRGEMPFEDQPRSGRFWTRCYFFLSDTDHSQ